MRTSSSPRFATHCSTSPGTRSSTGIWSWPRSHWRPVVPFVTETLWTALTGAETIVTAAWPTAADSALFDPAAEADVARLQILVTEVRRFRAEQGLRPRQRVPAVLVVDEPTEAGLTAGLSAGLTTYAENIAALVDARPLDVATEVPAGWAVISAAQPDGTSVATSR